METAFHRSFHVPYTIQNEHVEEFSLAIAKLYNKNTFIYIQRTVQPTKTFYLHNKNIRQTHAHLHMHINARIHVNTNTTTNTNAWMLYLGIGKTVWIVQRCMDEVSLLHETAHARLSVFIEIANGIHTHSNTIPGSTIPNVYVYIEPFSITSDNEIQKKGKESDSKYGCVCACAEIVLVLVRGCSVWKLISCVYFVCIMCKASVSIVQNH